MGRRASGLTLSPTVDAGDVERQANERERPVHHRGLILCLASAIVMACDGTAPTAARPVGEVSPGQSGPPWETTLISGPKSAKRTLAGRLALTNAAGNIITMWPNGSDIRELPEGWEPTWSADGGKLAFYRTSWSPGGGGIFVMDADGSNVTRVVAEGFQPSWSPDGTQLAYSCGGICVVNVDGTGRHQLTGDGVTAAPPNDCIRDTDPTWSPNGRTIAFVRWPDVSIPVSNCLSFYLALSFPFDFWTEVWLVEADGTGLRPLLPPDRARFTYVNWPSWSPDGTQLSVFRPHDRIEAISVVSADGSVIRDVVQRSPSVWDGALSTSDWSPDGTKIVFGWGPNWGLADVTTTVNWSTLRPGVRLPSSWTVWSWSRR